MASWRAQESCIQASLQSSCPAEAQLPEKQLKIESKSKQLSGVPRRGPVGWGGAQGTLGLLNLALGRIRWLQVKEQCTQKSHSSSIPGTGVT